jgi:hypothetical protein
MSQLSFSEAEYAGKRKKTRHEKFLSHMERAVCRGILPCALKAALS